MRRWLERGNIRSSGQVDTKGIVRAIRYVILRQPFSYFARAHTDDAVIGQIGAGATAEDLNGKRPLLETIRVAFERSLDDKLKKILTAFASAEYRAAQNPV